MAKRNGKCNWDYKTDHDMMVEIIAGGCRWTQIEKVLRRKHLQAVVGRTPEQAINSLRKRFAKIMGPGFVIIEPAVPYPGEDCGTPEEEWDARKQHRIEMQ